ncbi:MAG: membrane lipoprotein lipid attachment site-containing protein [Nanoarchaeota archaeon]|nr:membrane lipoprotein lipid attachment site-containing protein [Nanoarchaeota archaeon]
MKKIIFCFFILLIISGCTIIKDKPPQTQDLNLEEPSSVSNDFEQDEVDGLLSDLDIEEMEQYDF